MVTHWLQIQEIASNVELPEEDRFESCPDYEVGWR
jgi:hypothetical protein